MPKGCSWRLPGSGQSQASQLPPMCPATVPRRCPTAEVQVVGREGASHSWEYHGMGACSLSWAVGVCCGRGIGEALSRALSARLRLSGAWLYPALDLLFPSSVRSKRRSGFMSPKPPRHAPAHATTLGAASRCLGMRL